MSLKPTLLQLFMSTDSGLRLGRSVAERFRAVMHDADRVPRTGGALVVGNHTLFGLDSLALSALLVTETGRTPRFLAERNLFRLPGLKQTLDAVGAVRGTPEEAVRLLEAGELVGVYPGGVDDSFKTSREAYVLKWGERAGFAKVAMRAKVPIVPIAATGIDELFEVRRREGVLGRWLLGSERYDFPVPSSVVPRGVPLDYFVLPLVDTSGDPDDPRDVERVRRDTYDAVDGVLAAYREGRGARAV